MPIEHAFKIKHISRDEFYAIDYDVMGLAFSIHRDLGRLWSETIYQNELAYRCQKAGFEKVNIEVPIHVTYKDFQKIFYIDLLINDAIIYELKTAQILTGKHHQQTLNYLLLLGMHFGKLINMRPPSVETRFASTRLSIKMRYDYTIDNMDWQNLDADSLWLNQLIMSLIKEWGAFLDTILFYDAIMHFRGGEENVIKKIEVMNATHILGKQKVHLLNQEIAFKISSMTKDEQYYENHLRRFINYTSLKAIHWINFNHHKILFKTIFR
jgi:iron complex transport system substrate-binding protein